MGYIGVWFYIHSIVPIMGHIGGLGVSSGSPSIFIT